MDAKIPHIKLPNSKLPEEPIAGFKPSPIMVVRTKDGLVAMNRKARRRLGIGVKHV